MKLKSKFLVLLLAVVFAFTMFAMAACGDDDEGEKVSISLSQTTLTLVEGGSNATVNATVKGTNDAVKWTVDKETVVKIQYEGKTCVIKPVGEGTAVVTATVGGQSAKCNVTVNPAPKPAVTITLSETALNLTRGAAATEVTATLANAEATDTVTWSLANGGNAVVTITPNGNKVSVLPIAVGTTTLTATLGDVTKDLDITVTKAPVSLELNKTKVELKKGEEGDDGVKLTETVIATVENNDEAVDWKIGSTNVATIEITDGGNTCTVTAVNVGTTTLTASVEGVTKTIAVVVDGEAGEVTIELSETEDFELTTGATKNISATVIGSLATPAWSVDDYEVIEIEGEGNEITVKALKEGSATLTVTVGEGEGATTETLTISVWDATSVTLDKTEITLFNDENDDEYSKTVTAAVTGKIKTAAWEITEGADYIEISGEDTNTITVTAKAAGTATIVAKIGEEVYATLTVTVKAPVSLEIDNETLNLKVGGSNGTITATVGGTEDEIEYEIGGTDADCVTIVKNGNVLTVTPEKEGTATITISVGGKTATCAVTVAGMPVITFTATDTFGYENGDVVWHKAIFAANPDITTSTTVEATATVNGTAVSGIEVNLPAAIEVHVKVPSTIYDNVVINYTFKNGEEVVATAQLNYTGAKELIISEDEKSISKGTTLEVSVIKINGSENTAGKQIVWTITNPEGESVATIPENSTGASVVVSAVAAGTATLTCTVGEGDDAIVKTCAITVVEGTVNDDPPVDVSEKLSVIETYPVNNVTIMLNCDATMAGKIANAEATATVDDGDTPVNLLIHQVYGDGPKYVKLQAPGDFTHKYAFTIKYKNAAGKVIADGTVTRIADKDLKIDKSSFGLTLATGTVVTETIVATVAGPVEGKVVWTSSDEDVATAVASEDGLTCTVTAVAKGEATITATIDGMTKTCKVNVYEEGDDPPPPPPVPTVQNCKIDKSYGGGVHVHLLLEHTDELAGTYAEIASKFAYVKVNGVKNNDMKDMFAYGPNGDYRVNVYMGGNVEQNKDYVFEICDSDGNVLLQTVALQWDGQSE